MTEHEIDFELQRGGRFVFFFYCISLLLVSFKRPSPVYFLRSGESAFLKSLPYTLITILLGWWGFPWGPIFTIQALYANLTGGEPVVFGEESAAEIQ